MTQIPVAAMLAALRRELRLAQAQAQAAGDLWFLIEEAELELQVGVTQDGDGKVGLSVLGLVEIEGGGGVSRERVQKVRLKLGPRGADKSTKVFAAGAEET